jgi:agmatinase
MFRDPNAAARPDSGIFGLVCSVDDAAVAVLPVPFDATTSYRKGAAKGPATVVAASRQVDVLDLETGTPYEKGIALAAWPGPVGRRIDRLNRDATRLADPIIAAGGVGASRRLASQARQVDAIGAEVNGLVHEATAALLRRGKRVALLGGDHSTPFGSIQAHAEAHPGMGILHVDAHADLRRSFEGFTWSHGSIMFNVATRIPGVSRIVQVGLRDVCPEEVEFARASRGRVKPFFDVELSRARLGGDTWVRQCRRIVEQLPREVYVSFDIDGLDPALCPHTGTPVPGGLSFHEAGLLLRTVVASGRRIVGVDLNEVAPGPDGDEWDGNVGARILYKLVGWMLASEGATGRRRAGTARPKGR